MCFMRSIMKSSKPSGPGRNEGIATKRAGGSRRNTGRPLARIVLGVVRGKVVEEAFKWVQSTADSVLGCFLVHLTTPVRSKKDSEYFCPGLLTSPSSPPHSLLRGGMCHW